MRSVEEIKGGLAAAGGEHFVVGEVGTGCRAGQVRADGPGLQDLSASSPSTPWHYLKNLRFNHRLVSVPGRELVWF